MILSLVLSHLKDGCFFGCLFAAVRWQHSHNKERQVVAKVAANVCISIWLKKNNEHLFHI